MMPDPVLLSSPRGNYRLVVVEQTGTEAGSWILTVSMEHAGGLEKFAFRCIVSQASLGSLGINDPCEAAAGMAGWLQRDFENVREAALKSIRTERRLAEFNLDSLGEPR
jgi:hypothetical protein